MDRRDFLQMGTAGLAGAGLASVASAAMATPADAAPLAAPAVVGQSHELVLAVPVALDGMALGGHAFALARQIEAASGGRYRVSLARIGVTGLEAVTTGAADLYLACEHQHVSWHPALVAYSALPGAEHLGAHEFDAWMRTGGGADLADAIGAETGAKILLAGHTGPGAGLVSQTAIENVSDLEGRTVATRGLGRDVARMLGATPVVVDDDEIASALDSGAIIAAEPFLNNMPKVARRTMAQGFHPGGFALTLGLRSSLWAKLGPSDRAMLEGLAAGAFAQSAAEAMARRAMAAIAARARHSPDASAMPAALAAAIDDAAQQAVSQLADHGATSRRVVESLRAFRGLVRGSSRSVIV
jgi:TRAP-type mannitol/chloroaromatic compound transport system substrate-binding protein